MNEVEVEARRQEFLDWGMPRPWAEDFALDSGFTLDMFSFVRSVYPNFRAFARVLAPLLRKAVSR